MISASHNPVEDNGIKFFGRDGFKLSDDTEMEIERWVNQENDELPRPVGKHVGRLSERDELTQAYIAHLNQTVGRRFDGLKIVLDCANGAASDLAPELFRQLGAEVIVIAGTPDGVNINDRCGSTHPASLQKTVVEERADVGLAFDGDADRLIAVDETGTVVDGDGIMCILATYLHEQGQLVKNTLVTTVMSNIGLHKALAARGIKTVQTKVGDRYVMEAMRQHGYNLGGEQSGHIVLLDHGTSGDGMLSAVQLVNVLLAKQQPLSSLSRQMEKFPQKLVNVRMKERSEWEENGAIRAMIDRVQTELGADGRILVRPSGTEPLIRVMVEGPDEHHLESCAKRVAKVIQKEMGRG